MGQLLSTPITTKETECGEDELITYAATAMHGWRRFMEDAHSAELNFAGKDIKFFGVFDGHSGGEVSKYLAKHLGKEVKEGLKKHQDDFELAIKHGYLEIDRQLGTKEAVMELKTLSGDTDDPNVNNKVEMLSQFLRERAAKRKERSVAQNNFDVALDNASPSLRQSLPRSLPSANPFIANGHLNYANEQQQARSAAIPIASSQMGSRGAYAEMDIVSPNLPYFLAQSPRQPGSNGRLMGSGRLSGSGMEYGLSPSPVENGSSRHLYLSPASSPSFAPAISPPSIGQPLYAPMAGAHLGKSLPTSLLAASEPFGLKKQQNGVSLSAMKILENEDMTSPMPSRASIGSRKRERIDSITGRFASGLSVQDDPSEVNLSSPITFRLSTPRSPAQLESEEEEDGSVDARRVRSRSIDHLKRQQLQQRESSPIEIDSRSRTAQNSSEANKLYGVSVPETSRDHRSAQVNGLSSQQQQQRQALIKYHLLQRQRHHMLQMQQQKLKQQRQKNGEDSKESTKDNGNASAGAETEAQKKERKKEEDVCVAGSTAVVAFIAGNKLVVGNAGDSRCILCRDGRAIDMSIDHKPEMPSERERIYKAGAQVINGRVNGSLNLSRAVGDLSFKKNTSLPAEEQAITALPEIKSIDLVSEDEFIVLACDGIWEVMDSQQVCDFVRDGLERGEKLSEISESLVDACLSPTKAGLANDGTGLDNMTVVIAAFTQHLQTDSASAVSRDSSDNDFPDLSD